MFVSRRIRHLVVLTLMLAFGLTPLALSAQEKEKKDKKDRNAQLMTQGTPVLWRDPGDVSTLNLLAGPGGDEMRPDMSSITFIKEETTGWSPKFRVRDGAGKTWVAKMGSEAQPETVASRLEWAAGYMTEIQYLYPCVQIQGAPRTTKGSIKRCENNGFANVRFEARPENVKRLDTWSWSNNPFKGTKEFQGMIVLMALFNNWDLKDDNNKVLFVPVEGGQNELRYIISDLGATFGKTGNFISRSRNKPKDYVKTKLIKSVQGNRVQIDYSGKMGNLFDNITVEQAAWLGQMLSRLSDEQIADAFRAANYSPEEVTALTAEVREKINELTTLQPSSTASTTP